MIASAPRNPSVAAQIDIGRLLRSLHALAVTQESGQADAPLTRATSGLLEKSSGRESLKVVLLGLTPECQSRTLDYLLGHDAAFHLCKVFTPWQTGCVELHMQDQGFLLSCGSEHLEFSSLEPFLDALNQGHPQAARSTAGLFEPLRVAVAMPSQRQDLRLLLPESIEALQRKPEMLSFVLDHADLLVLAGPPQYNLGPTEKQVLEDIMIGVPGMQPVIVSDEPSSGPFWATSSNKFTLPPVHIPLSPSEIATGKFFFSEELESSRTIISQYCWARKGETLLTLTKIKTQEESDLCQRKKQIREGSLQGITADDGQVRKAVERVVSRLNEEFKALSVSLDDTVRGLFLPQGILYEYLHGQVQQFSSSDLVLTDDDKVTKISVKEHSASEVQLAGKSFLLSHLEGEDQMINEAIGAAAEGSSASLETIFGPGIPLRPQRYDSERVRAFAGILFQTKLKFKGEIPRHTKGQIFMHIIQSPVSILFTVMMPMSMFMSSKEIGPWLQKIKLDVALYCLLPMYIILPFFIVRKFHKQVEAAKEKELERLQEFTENDLERLMRQVLEERKKQLAEYLSRCLDDLRKQIETRVSEISRRNEQKRSLERQESASQIQGLDRRIRELSNRLQQCDAIARDFEQARRSLENAFATAISR